VGFQFIVMWIGWLAFQSEVMDADVFGEAAAGMADLKEDSGGDAAESGDVVGLDVAEAAEVSLPMVMAAAPWRMMSRGSLMSSVGR